MWQKIRELFCLHQPIIHHERMMLTKEVKQIIMCKKCGKEYFRKVYHDDELIGDTND